MATKGKLVQGTKVAGGLYRVDSFKTVVMDEAPEDLVRSVVRNAQSKGTRRWLERELSEAKK